MAGDAPNVQVSSGNKGGLVDDSLTNLNWLSNLNVTRVHSSTTSTSSQAPSSSSSSSSLSSSSSSSSKNVKRSLSRQLKVDSPTGLEKVAKEKDLVNKIISRNFSSSGEKENLGTQLVSSTSRKQNSTSFLPGNPSSLMYTDPDDNHDQNTDDSIDDCLNEPELKRTRISRRKNIFIEIVKDKLPFLNKSTSTAPTESVINERNDIINSTSSSSITTKTPPATNSSNLYNSNVAGEHLLSEISCDFPSSTLFGTDFCGAAVGDSQDFLQTPDFYATFPDVDSDSRGLKENEETKTSNGGIFLDPDKLLEQFEAETEALDDKESSDNHRVYSFDDNGDFACELTTTNDKSDAKRDLFSDHSPLDLMVQGTALKSSDLNLWRDSSNFYDQMSPLNCSIGDSFDSDIGFDLRLNQQPADDGSFEATNFSWINESC